MSGHLRALGRDFRLAVTLSALNITFLADQAWLMGDAIARTLWRLFVSRRHLLEWTPAAQSYGGKASRSPGVRRPNVGSVCPRRDSVASGAPFRAWRLADCDAVRRAVADFARCRALRQLSSGRREPAKISEAQSLALRQTARRTWRFFETFVTADDNMLPPDNFQEDPTSADRPPNLADQHRIVSAFRRLRPRLRLDWHGPDHRTAGSDACDDGSHAALSRPLLQLVRHPRSQGARAQICVLRRQRQSGRTSHRDRQCLQRVAAIADDRRVASGRNRRRPRSDRRTRRSTCVSVAELRR